eukprot:175904-Rhodomonas_salina.4
MGGMGGMGMLGMRHDEKLCPQNFVHRLCVNQNMIFVSIPFESQRQNAVRLSFYPSSYVFLEKLNQVARAASALIILFPLASSPSCQRPNSSPNSSPRRSQETWSP